MSPNLMRRKMESACVDRRTFIAGAGALMLAGCTDASASIRYRVVCKLLVDGKPVEGSTVMELKYSRLKNSALGYGGATSLKGEAMVIDIPGRPSLFVLPYHRAVDGSPDQFYELYVLGAVGVKNSIGSLTDEDLARVHSARGRFEFEQKVSFPITVLFRDQANPMTVKGVDDLRQLGSLSPGLVFQSLYIETTTDKVTSVVRKKIPWIDKTGKIFPHDPPGKIRAVSKRPIEFVIHQGNFFPYGT